MKLMLSPDFSKNLSSPLNIGVCTRDENEERAYAVIKIIFGVSSAHIAHFY